MKAVGVRFFRDKGGTGTVVGTVMAIMIIMLIIGGVFLWSSTVTHYMSNFDRERLSENAAVSATWTQTSEGKYDVIVRVKNTGTIDLSLASLWLIEVSSGGQEQHARVEFNPYILVGENVTILSDSIYIQNLSNSVGGIDPSSSTYKFKVVTSRGNVFEAKLIPYYAEGVIDPIVVNPDPSESRAEIRGNNVTIQLSAYNRLDESITIGFITARPVYTNLTVMNHGDAVAKTAQFEMVVLTNWTLNGGETGLKIFEVEPTVVFNFWSLADYIRVELISTEYKVVGGVFLQTSYPTEKKVYNFSQTPRIHVALWDNNDTNIESATSIDWTSPADLEEFTGENYSKISNNDKEYMTTTADKGNYAQHIFRFKIEENPKEIVSFTVKWIGYKGSKQAEGRVVIWNSNTNLWENIGGISSSQSNNPSVISEEYIGIARLNYIDESKYIYLMAYCQNYSINTDYVEVEVTYIP